MKRYFNSIIDKLDISLLVKLLVVYFSILIFRLSSNFKVIHMLSLVIKPLLFGFVLAWLVNPLVNMLSKRMNRLIASLISLLIIPISLLLLFIYALPSIIEEINEVIAQIPSFIDMIDDGMTKISDGLNLESYYNVENIFNIDKISISDSIPIFEGTFETLSLILLSFTIAIYLSLDFERLKSFIKEKVTNKTLFNYIVEVDHSVRSYTKGILLVTIYLTTIATFGFWVVGVKQAIIFGILVGVLDIIPYLGPILASVPILIIAFLTSFSQFIKVGICLIVIQIIEGSIIQPYILSKETRLHPVLIILSLIFFGALYGILGMLAATPITLILVITYKYLAHKNSV